MCGYFTEVEQERFSKLTRKSIRSFLNLYQQVADGEKKKK